MSDEGPLFPTQLADARETFPDPGGTPRNEHALQCFIDKGELPPVSERAGLMRYIQRLSIDAAVRGDYGEADRCSELNRKFYDACVESEGRARMKSEIEAMDARIAAAHEELAEVERKWEAIFAEVKAAERSRMEQLIDSQGHELVEFDTRWRSDECLRPYAKQSSDLLELRMKEKSMLLAKMFKEADVLRRRGDEIEVEETKAAQARAEKEAIAQRMQLIGRQDKEIEQMKDKASVRMEVLEQKRDKEIALAKHKIAKLETQKALIGRSKRRDTEAAVRMRDSAEGAGKLSPRSHHKMEMYKRRAMVARLTIQPIMNFPKSNSRALRMPKHKI